MKFAPIAAALLLTTVPVAAIAEDSADMTTEQAALFTIDTPIETLMDDAGAKAVVDKHMGGQDIAQHPMYAQFKAMSFNALAPFSQGMITDEMLANINADLALITEATPIEAEETASQ